MKCVAGGPDGKSFRVSYMGLFSNKKKRSEEKAAAKQRRSEEKAAAKQKRSEEKAAAKKKRSEEKAEKIRKNNEFFDFGLSGKSNDDKDKWMEEMELLDELTGDDW